MDSEKLINLCEMKKNENRLSSYLLGIFFPFVNSFLIFFRLFLFIWRGSGRMGRLGGRESRKII